MAIHNTRHDTGANNLNFFFFFFNSITRMDERTIYSLHWWIQNKIATFSLNWSTKIQGGFLGEKRSKRKDETLDEKDEDGGGGGVEE